MTSLLSFSETAWRGWFNSNQTVVYPMIGVYLLTVFGTQVLMRPRKPVELQRFLFLWNLGLAVFSIMGSYNTLPEMLGQLRLENRWHTSICTNNYRSDTFKFWFLLFVLSKAAELGDTAFIVLRKRPLNFLHWYHHASILWVCWTSYHDMNSTSGWYTALNYTVHAVMYSYYAIRSLNVRVGSRISMAITAIQILQMVAGVSTSLYAIIMPWRGYSCATNIPHAYAALFISSSYFVLFGLFFHKTYLQKSTKRKLA